MSEENLEVLRRVFDAIGSADVDALALLYTDDYVLELPFAEPEPVRIEGLASVRPYLARAFEMFRFTLEIDHVDVLVGGDLVARYHSEGRVVPTGRPYANDYVGIWRFRDGKVRTTTEWYNPVRSAEEMEGM